MGGRRANRQGAALEGMVEDYMRRRGYVVVPSSEYQKNPARYGSRVLETNVPFQSIYGHRGRTEFRVHSDLLPAPVRLETKWQQSAGSADEKLPFTLLNAYAAPEQHVILLVDGGGAKAGAIEWLRREAELGTYAKDGDRVSVMNLAEWVAWANEHLEGPPTSETRPERTRPRAACTDAPFPQADDLEKLPVVLRSIQSARDDRSHLAGALGVTSRQASYYKAAVRFLGFAGYGLARTLTLTDEGRAFLAADQEGRNALLRKRLAEDPVFGAVLDHAEAEKTLPKRRDIEKFILSHYDVSGKTLGRRAGTVLAWAEALAPSPDPTD